MDILVIEDDVTELSDGKLEDARSLMVLGVLLCLPSVEG